MTTTGNIVTIEILELKNLLIDAATIALRQNQVNNSKEKATISLRQAYKRFGSGNVNRWLSEKLLHKHQDGPGLNYRIDIVEIEALSKANNRVSYYRNKGNEQCSKRAKKTAP
jgi:hypothetical protein